MIYIIRFDGDDNQCNNNGNNNSPVATIYDRKMYAAVVPSAIKRPARHRLAMGCSRVILPNTML